MNEAERPVSLGAAGRSALLLTGAAVLVQGVGFVRQLFLAAEIGAASGLDAMFIALAVPLALVAVFTAGVRPALLPAYAEARDEHGSRAARRLVGTVLFWMALLGLVLSLLMWVFAGPLVAITGPGLVEAGTYEDAVGYLRALAPLALLGAVTSVFYALCQAEFQFPAIAFATFAEALLTLTIMVSFWDSMGLDALVVGTLVGAMASLLIVVSTTLVRRIAPLPTIMAHNAGLAGLVRHAVPLSLSAIVLQVNEFVRRAFASVLLQGGVSVLRFGDSLVRLPFAAISPAYSAAIYPSLVEASRGSHGTELAKATERILCYAIVFFVPLAALTMAVAPVATNVAYDRGAFSSSDLILTAQVVAASAPLIVSWTIVPTLASALNARRKGTVLLAGGLVNVAASIALTFVLGSMLGVLGVTLASTIVSFIVIVFLGHRLLQVEPTISAKVIWRTLLKAVLATAPAALVFGVPIWAGMASGGLGSGLVTLVIAGLVGLASYYVIARSIGLSEAGAIILFGTDTARRAFRLLRRV